MNKKYRKAIIAGNWKMNMTASAVRPFIDELRAAMPKLKTCDAAICAPFPLIPALGKALRDFSRVAVGAQDVCEFPSGAHTGEVSCDMLTALGVTYVIVGHSERREYQHEDDFKVNAKLRAAIAAGMTGIVCVGESLEQRNRGLTLEHIDYQVSSAVYGLTEEQARRCVVAYEPLWAIGTGVVATAEQAQEVCAEIRAVLKRRLGARTARAMSILYGGSMNAKNAAELLAMPDIDGGLIGGASLKPADFAAIIAATAQE